MSMSNDEMNNWNQQIIAEFRANGGKVESFGDAPMVILHSTGAKSGVERENPLVALVEGDDMYLFASKAGAHSHPDWYYNLTANPRAEIEYRSDRFAVEAVEITGAQRDAVYARQVALHPGFGEYEKATTRVIPVFKLVRS